MVNMFSKKEEFHKAKLAQNYKGQTVEHIVCLYKQHDLVEKITPRV